MMVMTYHCEVERRARIQKIIEKIGIGQVIIERYYRSPEKIRTGQTGTYTCITDTGITIIKSEDKKIVTMYVTTQRELVAVYGGTKRIPPFLKKRVSRNETFYIKEGKTTF